MTAVLTFLRDGDVDFAPVTSLPDGTPCDVCGTGALVLARVYGSDQPVWTVNRPLDYAEGCLDCAALALSVAVLQRSYGGSVVRVELAADVWNCRDDTGDC